jgi:peptidoglycan/xylan/chitin deacetylase (PgdA/CDA1 family)
MKLVVTVDVEEEGLFSGRYDRDQVTTENVTRLRKLNPIFTEHGIRPTLLVSYQVAENPRHRELLALLTEKWGAEIGAHLHHWNTPPLEPPRHPEPVPSELLPSELLRAKLAILLETVGKIEPNIISFRMGRFNMGPNMFRVLQESPIMVDSSIAPMRREYGGPNHLAAPTDPYYPDPDNPTSLGHAKILEVPITIIPWIPWMGPLLQRLGNGSSRLESTISWFSTHVASISAQPHSLGLRRLKAAARLHQERGGRVLSMYFHSSEIMPGGSREHRTEEDVAVFLKKLDTYLSWLRNGMGTDSVTLAEVGELYRDERRSR